MTRLVVDALGTPVRLTVPDHVAPGLRRTLVDLDTPPEGATPRELALEPRADGGLRLLDGGEVVLDHVDPALAEATIVWQLNAVAATTTDHVVLHAGCIAADVGGIVLPGPSGTGKSTLTGAAVADGFAYLTDEHAALSLRTGLLTPFAKPLDLGERGLVPASVLRTGSPGSRCAPAAAVFPRYAEGSPTASAALDPATTLLALCAHATNLPAVGSAGFVALAGMAQVIPAWQVTYGTTAGALDVVRRSVEGAEPARPVEPATVADPVTPTTTTVAVGGSVVALDTTTWAVHRFNASAGLVWLCAAETRDPDDLVALVRSEVAGGGVDPAHVVAAVEHLTAIGLLGGPER